ncbi:InlB B-repeat-containing protein [Fictibacillus barbaricus]|uniref:InlB B-repeat-containing protein n=1 Tax=Fictibacillus barbaricus TaxID=182136 RepID=A0ABS2ZGS3_9BACL|nr:InlB B-repeat-containing protein [Fictibacillus barbaricus]MBN3546621.1 InlB B-repeat-containing protein [Fictibacillus barbaricus]GGB42459.1 hypothetical protein GCM10007199_04720 [Fictibacillus barbaricus]
MRAIIYTLFLTFASILFLNSTAFTVEATGTNSNKTSYLSEVPDGYVGIYTPQDLDQIRNNLSGNYILMNDIDLSTATSEGGEFYRSGAGWEPIGTQNIPFTGILDGNGYQVIGMKINIISEEKVFAGLIGYAKNATIKNIGMTGGEITAINQSIDSSVSEAIAGSIIGSGSNIKIDNSYNTNKVYTSSYGKSYSGGIIGNIPNLYSSSIRSSISNSFNTGEIIGKNYTGGIAGSASYTDISQTYNTGTINKGNTNGKTTGGIAGYVYYSSISSSYNTGNIEYGASGESGGGIVGSASKSAITESYNRGNITSTSDYAEGGGIAGSISNDSKISHSNNSGTINSRSYAGGITGQATAASIVIESYNSGIISGNYSGGIIGYSSESHVKNAFNLGAISASYYAGGIVGDGSDSTIQLTYNVGRVYAPNGFYSSAGEFAGKFSGTITNSYHWNSYSSSEVKISFEDMIRQESYEGFDFESVWTIEDVSGYPFPTLRGHEWAAGTEHNVSMKMKSSPTKIVYGVGEEMDLTGAAITLTTNWGNETETPITNSMIYSDNTKYPGNPWVSVRYDTLYTSFQITVKKTYNVIFKDIYGNVLKTQKVLEGESAIAPEVPALEGYSFTGWDKDFSIVTANTTVTAQYKPNTYTVNFLTHDDKLIETKTVEYGQEVIPPEAPARTGYTFYGWDHFLHSVTSDLTVKPQYHETVHTVIFKSWDGKELLKTGVVYGSRAFSPNPPVRTGYTFTGWDKDFSKVMTDLTITALYKINTYTVTFKNGSTTLKTAKINHGARIASYTPIKSGETFIGWYHDAGFNKKFSYSETITNHKTLYAKFAKNTVTPATISASSAGYSRIKVSWSKVTGATGYELYRSTSPTGTYTKAATLTSGATISYINGGLTTGKVYYYKVRAYRLIDGIKVYSSHSKVVSAKPVLAAPAGLNVTKITSTSVKISWTKGPEASGYEVFRATASSGTYTRVATISNGATISYTNKGLSKGKTYYYKVRAYRTVNGKKIYSSYSTVKSIKL